MPDRKPPYLLRVPLWGLFLLFLGVTFLLQTFNVLPWGLWSTLWRFWPVLLINAGLSILLRRYNTWLVSILILTLLFGSLGIAIWQYGGVSAKIKTNTSLSALEVDERRFPLKGDFYVSPDFENAGNRVELELDCSLGRVLVK